MAQPCDYAVTAELAERVSKGGVEMLSVFGRHAYVQPPAWKSMGILSL